MLDHINLIKENEIYEQLVLILLDIQKDQETLNCVIHPTYHLLRWEISNLSRILKIKY